jgi:hypothetical protein
MPTVTTKTATIWSLAVVKSHVKAVGTTKDAEIALIADGVSVRIEEFLRRKVVTQAVTEVLSPECPDRLSLRNYPVTAISELKTRASLASAWIVWSASDYELDGEHGWIYPVNRSFVPANDGFPSGGPRTVSVTYNAGWGAQDSAAIPSDIVQVGLDFVKWIYERWANDLSATSSMSSGGKSATLPKDLPDDVKAALIGHRKARV